MNYEHGHGSLRRADLILTLPAGPRNGEGGVGVEVSFARDGPTTSRGEVAGGNKFTCRAL